MKFGVYLIFSQFHQDLINASPSLQQPQHAGSMAVIPPEAASIGHTMVIRFDLDGLSVDLEDTFQLILQILKFSFVDAHDDRRHAVSLSEPNVCLGQRFCLDQNRKGKVAVLRSYDDIISEGVEY